MVRTENQILCKYFWSRETYLLRAGWLILLLEMFLRVISPAPHHTVLSFLVLEKLVLRLCRNVHNNSTFVHASLLRY